MGSTSSKTKKRQPVGTEVSKTSSRIVKGNAEQLLPGIPDEISLDLIVPQLPWRAFSVLSSVSPDWLRAIQSRQVYDARVRCHSTETFVVLFGYSGQISLYSMRDNSCCELPRIPFPELASWSPVSYQYLSLDGKLYVFGFGSGLSVRNRTVQSHGLDLAAHQRQWEHCGSLRHAADGFEQGERVGYSLTDEKIFIFVPGSTAKVYGPKSGTSFLRKTLPPFRYISNPDVATLGEEFLVYGGRSFDRADVEPLEVYNPVKDEWRTVGHFRNRNPEHYSELFTSQGKIYAMSSISIDVYDSEKKSWRKLHSCSYPGIGPIQDICVRPKLVLAVDDELLVVACFVNRGNTTEGTCLLQSKGFGSEKEGMVWERVRSFSDKWKPSLHSMVPIKL